MTRWNLSPLWVVIVLAWCVPAGAAERGKEPAMESRKAARLEKGVNRRAEGSVGAWHVFSDLSIQQGKTVTLDVDVDFTSADRVAVMVRAASKSPADLAGLVLHAYWSVADADYFYGTEFMSGTQFVYTNTGAIFFQVCGSQLRLLLRNEGDQAIVLDELTVFRRSPLASSTDQ